METEVKTDELIARYYETGSHVKGVDPEELKSIEDKFRIKFPESYKYILLLCDGMADECFLERISLTQKAKRTVELIIE